ncbi:UDP-N-acetylmuramoyl-tripeptide--D-alanyl-D-alanine ligase [Enterococcus rivorum]|uniref:UDP-N-acetylmuramoyl-tripeptide--D-alanyl-D-alanine ligase n=1 Tax=Enterococcus rivorum TaxID=762845 RepID=A0A1E5L1A5_9ENTE|nr:UDP-N-acetylmuramoyl-tripeptide--D-alanyl-D-alanine ligase [Enterococcus rivorum]MBP2098728.1 UDP-N-acetylmuramoyl-tripeptide--D-alanyl-D-alanine ligase [Enterococcus rivorum]OEH83920.1 UDP-N-acetylmuramoyl-tripeptide--D-alanyl-D-alanine ligase [Enterococcus rivorum]
MELTFWEIAQAVQATNDWKKWPNFEVVGVEFDSRKMKLGDLFVPLKGESDGHKFINGAIEKGAKATFWSWSEDLAPEGFPIIQVEDTLSAMQELAVYYVLKKAPSVIAITGSNGKTTTKDMTEAVLSEKFHTYKTQGNYNNDIGLPYTILQMPDNTEKLILEMGMDHAGEISFLSKLARPEVAAITMIGEAHVENLGSREGIAQTKMEIVAGLSLNGLLIVPENEPLLLPILKNVTQKVETFGLEKDADYTAETITLEKEKTIFRVKGLDSLFSIPVPGSYNVTNALIAIAIGRWYGLTEAEITRGLASFQLTKNRTEWLKSPEGIEILSDVYNANPTAMGLVLESFCQMPTTGNRVAVLGDMLELGPDEGEMHRSMSAFLNPSEISTVFVYGEVMKELYLELVGKYSPENLFYFTKEEKRELIDKLKTTLKANDMVVLKASNGMGLNQVVSELTS